MDEVVNKIVDELLNQSSILQLGEAVAKISKEIEKRKKEIRLNALKKFKQAFEEYASLDSEIAFFAVCEDCDCNFEINGEEALREFFKENGV